jgi:hypothetical protein
MSSSSLYTIDAGVIYDVVGFYIVYVNLYYIHGTIITTAAAAVVIFYSK